jgi:DNA-binding transcriptional ArsR family regulator
VTGPGHGAVEDVLLALADPIRRRILDTLANRGGGTATSLADGLLATRQAVVKHLVILKRAGVAVGDRVGREVVYQVRSGPLDTTAQWMSELSSTWELRLRALRAIAEAATRAE